MAKVTGNSYPRSYGHCASFRPNLRKLGGSNPARLPGSRWGNLRLYPETEDSYATSMVKTAKSRLRELRNIPVQELVRIWLEMRYPGVAQNDATSRDC